MSDKKRVSVSKTIAASPDAVFDLLANPYEHHAFDGSGTVKAATFGPERLQLGAKFGMKMKLQGVPYRMTSTVKEFEENRLISWCHFGKHLWRYELEPEQDGTGVTESFDWSTALSPKFIELAGYPKRHVANMTATLERLDEHLKAPS